MKIEALPSPNFNDRKFDVDMLVLHYSEAEVSAHYMVWEDGRIVQLVGEDKRAWHAGVSSWQGDNDLNSRSIGIEIVNGGHDWPLAGGGLPPYPNVQIEAVIALCQGILSRWDIPQSRIVGHSDIAPVRKDDPGEHFPWARLAGAGVGLWLEAVEAEALTLMGRGLGQGDDGAPVERLQNMLSEIGYTLDHTGLYDAQTEAVTRAFQRRWVQDQVTGQADLRTLRTIGSVHALYKGKA